MMDGPIDVLDGDRCYQQMDSLAEEEAPMDRLGTEAGRDQVKHVVKFFCVFAVVARVRRRGLWRMYSSFTIIHHGKEISPAAHNIISSANLMY